MSSRNLKYIENQIQNQNEKIINENNGSNPNQNSENGKAENESIENNNNIENKK